MKKFIAIALSLCMVCAMSVSAFAAEVDTDGGSGTTPVYLSSTEDGSIGGTPSPTAMSVTVPTALPMAMSQNGDVTTATDCKIINNSYGAVRVKSVIEIQSGTFNTNGYNVTGTVTFNNELAKGENKLSGALPTNTPVITDGVTGQVGAPTDHYSAQAGNKSYFLSKVIFNEYAAGHIDGLMHNLNGANKEYELTLKDGAYAAIAYGYVLHKHMVSEDGKTAYMGKDVTINMTQERAYNKGRYADVEDALVNAVGAIAEGATTAAIGDNATFLFKALESNSDNYGVDDGPITIADGATVTIVHYNTKATMSNAITVGKSAILNIYGAGADDDKKLTIDGAVETKVLDNGKLNLTYVKHARGTSVEEINLGDGATISMDTVDNGDPITGIAYQKTLPTQAKTEVGVPSDTESGGQYKWTTADMAWKGKANYIGVIVGHSANSYIHHVVADTVKTEIQNAGTEEIRLGGIVGKSANDMIADAQVLSCELVTKTASDFNAMAAGLVGEATGSKIYKSFVRGGETDTHDVSYKEASLVGIATNIGMYGCYAQGVETAVVAVSSASGSEFVGCYATQTAFIEGGSTAGCYNCYFMGSNTTTKDTDTAVGLTAGTLQGSAIGTMNSELMAVEGDEKDNDSGFNWAEYGSAIAYVPTETENNGYPVHGEMVFVEIKVGEDSVGYGTAKLTSDTANTLYPITETNNYASYWVLSGTNPKLTVTPIVTLNSAKYGVNVEPTTDITVNTATQVGATSADAAINLTFTPTVYTQYKIVLKDSGKAETSSGTRSTVYLSNSTVERETKLSTEAFKAEDAATIKTLVLSVDNGAVINLPGTPDGWTKAEKSNTTYVHYNMTGATAAAVQEFLRKVSVTAFATTKYNVSAFVYATQVPYITSNYGGHFYQYVGNAVGWETAYTNASKAMTQLGKAHTYLATITSKGENDYLYEDLGVANAWMGAVSSTADDLTVVQPQIEGWQWVSGPEAGTALSWSNWCAGEPNNYGGWEWAAAFAYGGQNGWNDFDDDRTFGYIVEYQAGEIISGSTYANDVYTFTKVKPADPKPEDKPEEKPEQPVYPDYPILPVQPSQPEQEETEDTGSGVGLLLNDKDHIAYLQGYEDGTFRPENNMTRAEVAQMFYNLLWNKNVRGSASFLDVPSDAWYADAVLALANLGIIEGSYGYFEPNRFITREEFVTIALRFATHTVAGTKQFSDVSRRDWSYDSIMAATGYGWIGGYEDGTFRPKNPIKRSEVANIVNKMLDRQADAAYVDANVKTLKTFADVVKKDWFYYPVMEAVNGHEYEKTPYTEIWND